MRASAVVLSGILACVSCARNPEVAKRTYLKGGNEYFEKGKFQEALIQYGNARQQDWQWGPSHYKLGLTYLKLGRLSDAVPALRRAIDLLPTESPDHWDAVIKLSEIYLAAASADQEVLEDVAKYCGQLLRRDPNSFDGHRLSGDLEYARAALQFQAGHRKEGQDLLDAATGEYRKADRINPGQQGTSMQLARSLAIKRNFAEAEKLYRSVIEKDKTSQSAYAELYRLFLFQNRPAEGEQVLKLAYQNNPKQPDFLAMLAMHYIGQGRNGEVRGVVQQIKAHAGDFERAYLRTGELYLRMGDRDAAVREYREGIARDPKKTSTYLKRVAEVLLQQGKRAEAAEANSQILKDNPKDIEARGLAAAFLLDKGDVTTAMAELQAVLAGAPDNASAHYNLGRAHALRGELELARQQFSKAIELRTGDIRARLALAQLQVNSGDFDAALQGARQVLATDGVNINAQLVEAAALTGLKKFGDSRKVLDSILNANPGSTEALLQRGALNLAERRFPDAEDAFRRAYQMNPADPRGPMGVVDTNMAQGRTEKALAFLQAETDKAPNSVDLRLALGDTAVRAGRYELAIREFQKALPLLEKGSKTWGDVCVRIGESYRRQGDLHRATQVLQDARQVLPDHVEILSRLAMVLDSAGRKTEAREVYEAVLTRDPDNGLVLNNLAFLLAENGGNLDDALLKAQRARQLLPHLDAASDTLGWIYLKKNLGDSAIPIFEALVAKQGNRSTYHNHQGMALAQKGHKTTRAIEELQQALKSKPDKDEKEKIQQTLRRLS
jgi:tetratricopeptide (TPR) repeat protein